MRKGWTTTKLIATGALGVLWAVISLPGLSIGLITHLFSGSLAGLMLPLTVLIIRQFGAGTIATFVFSLLTTPLSTLGPVFLIPRLLLDTSLGFTVDLLYLYLRRNDKIAALATGFFTTSVWAFVMAKVLILLGSETVERSLRFILSSPLILTFLFSGLIKGFIAYLVYMKIKEAAVIKRIQT